MCYMLILQVRFTKGANIDMAKKSISMNRIKEALTQMERSEAPKETKERAKNYILGFAEGLALAHSSSEPEETER